MNESSNQLINVLAAFSLALGDKVRRSVETECGMTGAAPAALVSLQQFLSGQSTEALAHAIGLTHSGAVRLVNRLSSAGYVERRPGVDARSTSIVLTKAGRTQSRKVTAARARAVASILEPLGGEDRQRLLEHVNRLVAALTDERLDARAAGDEPDGWMCRLCDAAACGRPDGACPAASTAAARGSNG